MKHAHTCMSCGGQWYCSTEGCQAKEEVFPTLIVPGARGPQIFDHVCQRKVLQWQPIETAPKDVLLLLYAPARNLYRDVTGKSGEFRVSATRNWCWASHWMPLPVAPDAPPSAAPQEGKADDHPYTEACGFDRNASHTEDTYVCTCGYRAPRGDGGEVIVKSNFEDANLSPSLFDSQRSTVFPEHITPPAATDGFVRVPKTPGQIWSFLRTVLSQGGDIQLDYQNGKYKCYEEYATRLDGAARERTEELLAAPSSQPSKAEGET